VKAYRCHGLQCPPLVRSREMRGSANFRNSTPGNVLLIGGCYGTYFLYDSDDEMGRTNRRQFILANCVVLTLCLAIVALVVAVAEIVTVLGSS
jgi:hypothetical protein